MPFLSTKSLENARKVLVHKFYNDVDSSLYKVWWIKSKKNSYDKNLHLFDKDALYKKP